MNVLIIMVCFVFATVTKIGNLNVDKEAYGLAVLENKVYVGYSNSSDVHVFEILDGPLFNKLPPIVVPELRDVADISACRHNRCLYIADNCGSHRRIHRVKTSTIEIIRWPVEDSPIGLSVSSTSFNVIVTCSNGKINEFASDGQPLRQIKLDSTVAQLHHAIHLGQNSFVVCHGLGNSSRHGVCEVNDAGKVLRRSYDSSCTRLQRPELNVPVRLAEMGDAFVFVADQKNSRVLVLSSQLDFVSEPLTGLNNLRRMWFERRTGQLFVGADNFINVYNVEMFY